MLLDNRLRHQYLEAMGIKVWVRQTLPAATKDQAVIDDSVALPQGTINADCFSFTGTASADWLILWAMPALADTEREAAHQLLTELISALGLSPQQAALLTVFTQQFPTPLAISIQQLVTEQIKQISPRIVLVFGELTARQLLVDITYDQPLRGKIHKFADISLVVTYDPVVLLSAHLHKRQAWQDLQFAHNKYNSDG